jgi:acyl-CoA synthetase (AMP-forming)/AMP-acid ligase II
MRPAEMAARIDAWPNLVTMFLDRADEHGERPLLSHKQDGAWVAQSWAECRDTVASLSAALIELGINRGDRVMLVSENRPEWCLADLAIMAAGAITVPAYTTNTEADYSHILSNSGARAVIVSTPKLAADNSCRSAWAARSPMRRGWRNWRPISRRCAQPSWSSCRDCSKCCAPALPSRLKNRAVWP